MDNVKPTICSGIGENPRGPERTATTKYKRPNMAHDLDQSRIKGVAVWSTLNKVARAAEACHSLYQSQLDVPDNEVILIARLSQGFVAPALRNLNGCK